MTASQPAEPAPVPTSLELFLGFMRVAAFSFGGVLPWAHFVLVERRRWLTSDEFTDMLALCQLLPGPNIVNMSVAIGARFHGARGALAAILGLTLLPIVIVLALATLYAGFKDVPAVDRALDGMAAAAAGLVIAMAAKMAMPMLRRRPWGAAPIILVTFVLVALLRWPLLLAVVVLAPFSIALAWRERAP
ncbi:chromate transporter [Enterovirga rhinocerotis]|uniref:Chromate transporter n=1 Tax=Enterovirga rhinocerotis TaxID=1339210 RepID=A0A4R7BVW4_9HYPH|nr:chromate transporter [Enterovirga rhinocerotis]TDR89691.1 chromate transporter [Enterovirga rhinocerotis]